MKLHLTGADASLERAKEDYQKLREMLTPNLMKLRPVRGESFNPCQGLLPPVNAYAL